MSTAGRNMSEGFQIRGAAAREEQRRQQGLERERRPPQQQNLRRAERETRNLLS